MKNFTKQLFRLFSIAIVITFAQNSYSQNYLINGVDVTDCSGNIFDSGGAGGNYGNNQFFEITICPDVPGSQVVLDFTSFSLEAGFDVLCVYNGTTTGAPTLGCYDDDVPLFGLVQGSNPSGCITLQFQSDGSVVQSGFAASISCTTPCQTITSNFLSSNSSAESIFSLEICRRVAIVSHG